MIMGAAVETRGASNPQRTFSESLAVSIPDPNNPAGIAFDSGLQPFRGFSEIAAVDQVGNISFTGAAPLYAFNGSVFYSGGYFTSFNHVPVGFGAQDIIYVPEVNTFYVMNNGDNRVIAVKGEVDMTNGTAATPPKEVANLTLGRGPIDQCYNEFLGYTSGVYVLNYLTQSIGVINTTSNSIQANFTLPQYGFLTNIACDTWNGAIYLITSGGLLIQERAPSTLETLGTVALEKTTSPGGAITSVRFDSQNGLLYAVDSSHNQIKVIDPDTLKIVANITTPYTPWALATDTSDNIIFVSAINRTLVIDGYTNRVMASFPISPGPFAFAVDPYNRLLYASYEPGHIDVYTFSLSPPPQIVTSTISFTGYSTVYNVVTQSATVTRTMVSTTVVGAPQQSADPFTAVVIVIVAAVLLEGAYLAYAVAKRPK